MNVTEKCKQMSDKRYKGEEKKEKKSGEVAPVFMESDAKTQGKFFHDVISSAEEHEVRLRHIDENNKRECDLINLISKIAFLKQNGYVSEIGFKWLYKGVLYRGRIDRIEWDRKKNVLEINDLKSHVKHFMKEDSDDVTVPDVGDKVEYYYRLQLHFYAGMIKSYLIDELTEEHKKYLRRLLIGALINTDKPIHHEIAERCSLPKTTTIKDLFNMFLQLREDFKECRIAIAILHLDQLVMTRACKSAGGTMKKGSCTVIRKPYRYISNFLENEMGFNPVVRERKRKIKQESKRKAVDTEGATNKKRRRRRK